MLLQNHFLLKTAFIEHHQFYDRELVITREDFEGFLEPIQFKSNPKDEFCCFKIDNNRKPYTSYFIGTDWLDKSENKAVYIQPKLNKDKTEQVDYIQMLFSLLRNPETLNHVDEIYEIKWEAAPIEINQQQDLLTPLIVVQFLQLMQRLVRKGLKKSYYKVENNLYGKVKGKIIVASSIKHNLVKNKTLKTWCAYDEFGFNGLENRLLKKALVFVQKYLSSHKSLNMADSLNNLFNYINPAFSNISDEVSLHEVKQKKKNVFYKEYEEGIRLAKLILKKFGYNITNTDQQGTIKTPPFWIDMSKLFELYVLGLLKDAYGSKILYGKKEAGGKYGLPDYLFTEPGKEKVIDAKYKPIYQDKKYDIDNIRQISGYARDNGILDKLNIKNDSVVDCLIIYPNNLQLENRPDFKIDIEKTREIKQFKRFFRLGVPLPKIKAR